MTDLERFEYLFTAACGKGRGPELTADMGSPRTVGDARRIFIALPDYNGRRPLDRSRLELKYLDPIDW